MELKGKHANIKDFIMTYTPERQTEICKNPENCYFGDSPTLGMLNNCYGNGAAEAWLVPEIVESCQFFGLREQPDNFQLEKLVRIIVANYGYLKVDELQLFFFYFCSSRYYHFYNTFDPSIILQSIQEFLRERAHAYDEQEKRERDQERDQWRKNAVTYEEYLKIKNKM